MSRVLVTGATGFLGGYLVRRLLEAGHEVTALVRRAGSAPPGVREVRGDVARPETYVAALLGQDAAIHAAAVYEIPPRDRAEMRRVNVGGTRALIDTAIAARVPRIVHVSSTAALGDTRGREPGEEHAHDGTFRTYYEETKHIAHGLARARIAAGAPVSIAIPGGAFGAGDRSVLAATLRDLRSGKLPIQIETRSRFQLCHAARTADGIARVLERGAPGESYLLTGESFSMPELLARAAELSGRAPPRAVPPHRLRPVAFIADRLRPLGVALPLSGEALRIMDGSTYTYRSDKARRELGWDAGDVRADLARYLATL